MPAVPAVARVPRSEFWSLHPSAASLTPPRAVWGAGFETGSCRMASGWRMKMEGGRGADVTTVSLLLGDHPSLGFGSAASHVGSTGGTGTWAHSAVAFPLRQGTLQHLVGSCPCVGWGHPHCHITWVLLGHRGCPRRTGCLLSLSFCPASVAVWAENFQKRHPGCISYGCRTFPDLFLYLVPDTLLLLARREGYTLPLFPGRWHS